MPGVKLQSVAPAANEQADASLPDPRERARWVLAGALVVSVGVTAVMNNRGWTTRTFNPPKDATFQFSLFAAFYAAAQIIERLMELVAPILPVQEPTTDGAAGAAQVKADRAKMVLGVSTVAGVVAANAFGLYFLSVVGIHAHHGVDAFCTGLVIAAGTKPLHDFISLLQAQTTPKTGTGTDKVADPPAAE